jgi:hypothetical protein
MGAGLDRGAGRRHCLRLNDKEASMRTDRLTRYTLGLGLLVAFMLRADAWAQSPAVRMLDRISATATDSLGFIRGIRQLSDGRVLVNDATHRELILYDAMLRRIKVVADTNTETARAYGAGTGAIFRYAGDTTLYLDWSSQAFVTILPDGTLGRVFAVPRTSDISYYGNSNPQGLAGFDAKGRFIYRYPPRSTPGPPGASGKPGSLVTEDSAYLYRVDMDTRRVDTIARYKEYTPTRTGSFQMTNSKGDKIGMMLPITNPLPVSDDWAILADGSVAVVRSHDYHIDWIDADGAKRSTPPMSWRWDRVTDSAKRAIIDSLRSRADSVTYGTVKGPPPQYVDPEQLPDYRVPFNSPGAVGDADGHLWIQIALPIPPAGGPVYDVVDRSGIVVDRVQIPGATTIAGFGPGAIYLTSRLGTFYSLVKVELAWKR